mmetsp:Transcript_104342/g.185530  ORF Transcript_104342/g.185530 Transcript_104342/m.185530 type:complete len:251 (-) Transcript_104342:308-1060(-)|eukprot:CAMPEP_0197627564 /NCGR_PEP_ID=MMETSP1338-20131121/6147_1 /TAXON_ID=43686 ORGANISM="Pelagodinium beii, Strain RCC1491" /NCGR_SAMPLE_ID=MMETSP1338 /ASSEMBLY_ACC=CAM_ASM_000754 /LENGTH=250 /DNA_ID=CAMNT_0043198319 /DNA_START=41 /DNA_END=793 /DNA_ORIENTATION=+
MCGVTAASADGFVAAPSIWKEEAPVWDELTQRFWVATGVNAYEIPEAGAWQRQFQSAVEKHSVRQTVLQPAKGAPLDEAPVTRDFKLPTTPTRRPRLWSGSSSPGTPEKMPAPGVARRAARAAHTAALMAMSEKPGVVQTVHGQEMAFFRFEGHIFAVEARCPHQGGRLIEGEVGDIEDGVEGRTCYITCPVHKMRFDLANGRVLDGTCRPLRTFEVRIGEIDCNQKLARVHVGFESLGASYFGDHEELL